MYTGKTISLTNLLSEGQVDIEHTIPRSISFDNSDANLTVCDAHYNRAIKGNRIPTQLPNYETSVTIGEETYTAIKPRLAKWESKVEKLKSNIDFWKAQSRRAQTKDRKDTCVRQRHLWQMEYDYWRNKVERFKQTEVTQGFRNSQLVDTGVITRNAVIYLKSVFKNVEVQKGQVTADFRKMLGIQDIDEKKNRNLHSHHAIDAATLTMIPVAAKRDRMLELYYQLCEARKQGHDTSSLQTELERERKGCHLGNNVIDIVDVIEKNILVNHYSKDQSLAPAHRRARIRGKVVTHRDRNGNETEMWKTGDSIRGRLHKETYYGAIQRPTNEKGGFEYDGTLSMVVRVDIRSFSKMDDLSTIVDNSLRNNLHQIITRRIAQGNTFSEAITQDIWLLDKDGNEIKQDKNGRKLSPLRHVRCLVKAGRGYMTREKSLEIRQHLQTSQKRHVNIADRSYKQLVYAQNDTNQLFLLYEGIKKGNLVRKSRIISLYELSILKKSANGKIEQMLHETPSFSSITEKGITYSLTAIIKEGMRVIMWKDTPDEVKELTNEEISKRLYIVYKFNRTGADLVFLRNCKNSDDSDNLGLVSNNLNCLIEHRDFEIDSMGKINFID